VRRDIYHATGRLREPDTLEIHVKRGTAKIAMRLVQVRALSSVVGLFPD